MTKGTLLHDVGKVRIDANLLRKPAALTADEPLEMRSHPELGYQMLTDDGERDSVVLSTVLDHHERLDRSGYPRGLLVTDISVPVRIVSLCDVYAAMTEPRPYGTPLPWQEALVLMTRKRSRLDLSLMSHFTELLVQHCLTDRTSGAERIVDDRRIDCMRS